MITHDTPRCNARSRRRRALTALAAATATLACASSARAADTYDADVKLESAPVAMSCPVSFPSACFDPAEGNAATASVKLHRKFASIESICFKLRFEGDVIDPGPSLDQRGDWVQITFEGTWGFGFLNWSDEPSYAEREVCTGGTSEADAFADGKHDVTVNMVLGSATLAELQVSVTGEAK
jgi:hypothetical protein